MPTKTKNVTESTLRSVPLPNHGGRYAVVPHGAIVDETRKQLQAAGFEIEREVYKTSLDGQIAQGIYHLKNSLDADMGLMFAWSNSYNKMMRFKCAIGAQVFICMNGVVSGDMGSYNRKHVGNSTMNDVVNSINSQISKANEFFNTLVADKEMLKNITLSPRDKGRILGELYANDEAITLTQVGIVKREIDKPTYTYNSDVNSAWTFYNYITFALKESHPGHYIKDHQKVHDYFLKTYGSVKTITIDDNNNTVSPVVSEENQDNSEEEYMEPQRELVTEEYNDFGVNFM